MTRVLGIDPSVTATGLALPDGTTGVLKLPVDKGRWGGEERYSIIADHISRQLRYTDLAVIEDLVNVGRNAGHALKNGMVQGAIRYVLMDYGVPYLVVVESTLKKFATGKGNANKSDMAIAAFKRAEVEFPDDNQCDAWWLRQFGLHWVGEPEFELPALQTACLKIPKLVGDDPHA